MAVGGTSVGATVGSAVAVGGTSVGATVGSAVAVGGTSVGTAVGSAVAVGGTAVAVGTITVRVAVGAMRAGTRTVAIRPTAREPTLSVTTTWYENDPAVALAIRILETRPVPTIAPGAAGVPAYQV